MEISGQIAQFLRNHPHMIWWLAAWTFFAPAIGAITMDKADSGSTEYWIGFVLFTSITFSFFAAASVLYFSVRENDFLVQTGVYKALDFLAFGVRDDGSPNK